MALVLVRRLPATLPDILHGDTIAEAAIAKGLADIACPGQPNFSESESEKLWNQWHQPKFLLRLVAK